MMMRSLSLKMTILLALTLLAYAGPGGVRAHHLAVSEVLETLNRPDVKSRAGIHQAVVDLRLNRHLIIKVNDTWHTLPATKRKQLAEVWRQLWQDAMKNGIVSVLDAKSNQPVVNYSPSGHVSLTEVKR
jgi:hypothetical protein